MRKSRALVFLAIALALAVVAVIAVLALKPSRERYQAHRFQRVTGVGGVGGDGVAPDYLMAAEENLMAAEEIALVQAVEARITELNARWRQEARLLLSLMKRYVAAAADARQKMISGSVVDFTPLEKKEDWLYDGVRAYQTRVNAIKNEHDLLPGEFGLGAVPLLTDPWEHLSRQARKLVRQYRRRYKSDPAKATAYPSKFTASKARDGSALTVRSVFRERIVPAGQPIKTTQWTSQEPISLETAVSLWKRVALMDQATTRLAISVKQMYAKSLTEFLGTVNWTWDPAADLVTLQGILL